MHNYHHENQILTIPNNKLKRENTKNIDVRFQIMVVRKLGSLKHRTKNRE